MKGVPHCGKIMPFEMVHFINLSSSSLAAYKDYYELLNPIMFSSSIDKTKKKKKKDFCLERGNDAVMEEQRLKLSLRGFCWLELYICEGGGGGEESYINKRKT